MEELTWNNEVQKAVSLQLFAAHADNENPQENIGHRLLWTPNSDTEAAREFMRIKQGSAATERRYSRELYRFFLWMNHADILSLRKITPTYIENYLKFCIAPPESWCANTGGSTLITSPMWRPFKEKEKPSVNSIQNTLSILKSFFAYLQSTGYILGDPTRTIDGNFRSAVMATAAALSEHGYQDYPLRPGKEPEGLTILQWKCLLDTIDHLPISTPVKVLRREQAAFVIRMLYYTAARSEEARSHTHKAFRYDADRDCWTIIFFGKGAKRRVLPIHPELLDAIIRFRQFHRLSSFPDDAPLPLFPNYRIFEKNRQVFRRGMSERGAEDWIKNLYTLADRRMRYLYPDEVQKCSISFLDATLHTLRHTRARHMLFAEGVDLRLVQAFLGHSKILTTQGYTEPSMDELLNVNRGPFVR